ncbi:YcxB family protein [Streptomyces sp. GC420]|uniref:YcxB family protein n=1 Tax=Streptomyces sp. GC420 TaxID=2697568 RepID=UPI001414E087|nr:YcxB family protein [Streptomyces sp. GC420]NBM19272.1 hypothetical protein [Streptomyces sp. GC420]
MAEKAQVAESVKLVYQPTAEDIIEALHARAQLARKANLVRGGVVFVLVCALLITVSFAKGDSSPVLSPVLATVFAALAGAVVLMMGKLLQRRMAHRIVAAQGKCRTTVDDSGMRTVTENGEATVGWDRYPRYLETENLFVALSPDRRSVGVGALPKRGLRSRKDVDRLREILDRNAVRAGQGV